MPTEATPVAETPEQKIQRLEREVARMQRVNAQLEMNRALLKRGALLREGERVRFLFIHAERSSFPVAALCRVLGITRQSF